MTSAAVLELVLQFARRVQRIDVHHHQTRTQDGGDGGRILRHVGHHHRDAVARLQPDRLEIGRQRPALLPPLRVRRPSAHEGVGRLFGKGGETAFKHLRHIGVGVRVDLRRDAGGVVRQPDPFHRLSPAAPSMWNRTAKKHGRSIFGT
jgi:hypothetical protein